jgi:hypothetical protein
MELKFTVLFEEPFWVGIFERTDEAGYAVARHVFGAEPSAPEIHTFILKQYAGLVFSAPLPAAPETHEVSFKRRLREAHRVASQTGVTSKAHEAMRLQLEQNKQAHHEISKAERAAEKERLFQLAQLQKKEKHRGH